MTDKLKPCPFCGGEAALDTQEDGHGGQYIIGVVCREGCEVQAMPETWNTRAVDEENKRLREALERLIFANRNAFMRAVFDEGYETALIDAEKTLKENDDD